MEMASNQIIPLPPLASLTYLLKVSSEGEPSGSASAPSMGAIPMRFFSVTFPKDASCNSTRVSLAKGRWICSSSAFALISSRL